MSVAQFIVPNVPLIPQDLGMACWYASTQMLIQWRRNLTQSTEASFADPSELPETVALYQANNGLNFSQMIDYAKLMGLTAVPGMTPTLETVSNWLHDFGPIWAAGYKVTPTKKYGHVMVIVGVGPNQIIYYDPEPLNQGTVVYQSPSWLDSLLEIGRFKDVVTNFLHFPG